MSDKGALVTSSAGMRLIAQQTLLNRGDWARLRDFIQDSYTAEALAAQPVEARLAELEALMAQVGKLRVYQVVGAGKHQVVALMQGQREPLLYLMEMAVEEDFPHRILRYAQQPLA